MGKQKLKINWRAVLSALLIAGGLTLPAGLGVLDRADRTASDVLCQQRSASDGKIVIIGIDQRSMEEIGPYDQWERDVMARILEALNQSDICRPAVIGLDVLYTGETDPDFDAWLAEAAGAYNNVVTACAARFGTKLVEDGIGDYSLGRDEVVAFEEAYPQLRMVTGQAHINAMMDADGILRHHMLVLRLPNGQEIPSMALELAQRYQAFHGNPPIKLPKTNLRGFWYLPYCSAPGDMEVRSASSVLSGETPAEYFTGKIVLIGPYAAGLQDSYLTSIDHAKPMYGVEYHGNAIQALLWGQYKAEPQRFLELTVLFLLLLLTLFGSWRRSVKFSTSLWIGLSLGWLLLAKGLYEIGWVVHVLWIPTGVTIIYGGCLAVNYIQAAAERRKVTNTFKRYVAPEIVNELLQNGSQSLELGGQERDIAVLFVDVRGFTSMSEKLEPREVVEILNSYLSLIADCILRNGGTLDKFIGDAAMAFWGAPLKQDDYVLRAAHAAMDMVQGAEALSQDLEQRFGQSVSFGIGIHMGKAVVGNVGSLKRMDYTAIGDTVNTASRLESSAPRKTIYISREVADALGDKIEKEQLPLPLKVKGKEECLEVFKLLGIREGS
ncbi:adenylate/guanylate cyclase domain-containing protein [Lachnospiraceae bacterium 62-35]